MNRVAFIVVFLTAVFLYLVLFILSHPKIETWENEVVESEKYPSEAMNALHFMGMGRTYPDSFFPADKYYKAFEYSQTRMLKASETEDLPDSWECIGPENQGGRTIGICVDPNNTNVIYAGGASGGLWRLTISSSSYDWEYIETGYPVLGVNAIAVDYTNSDIIYIGTGEMYGYESSFGGFYTRSTRGSVGIGLLKSTDRGATWVKSIDWSYKQHRGILAIKMHPTDPKIVFAGTSEGVYRTKDGGENWEQVHNSIMAVDLAINPSAPDIVYASCGNLGSPGSGIYRSTSGGDNGTWTELSSGLPSSWGGKTLISLCKSSPNTIYASVADAYEQIGLYRTTDGGDSWTNVNSQDVCSYQGFFAHYIRVNPENSNEVMWAGVNFYTSTNGGQSLTSRSGMHVDHHCFADHPTDPDIVYFGNDGGVYRTTDGGGSFRSYNTGYVTAQFYNGFSCSHQSGDVALGGLQDNSTKRYSGSKSWSSELGGDGAFTAINTEDDDIMFGSSQNLSISRSTNGGDSWSGATSGITDDPVCFIAPFVMAFSEPTILYGGKSYVYKTTNSGSSWSKMNGSSELNGNPILAIGVSPNDPDVVYASTVPRSGDRGEVYASYNGGSSFTNVTGDLPDRYYLDFKISPHDDDVVYVTLLGFGTCHLYRTEDAGQTWDSIGKDLPDVPTSAVEIDPDNYRHIYVGNDFGVYVSTDYGSTWKELKDGMPTAALVMDLTVSPSNNKIRATTHGNGVYERTLLPATPIMDDQLSKHVANALYQNYPNPFRTTTKIEFSLAKASFVHLQIVNMKGQAIRTLAQKNYPAGTFNVTWDGRDKFSNQLPNGPYICRINAGSFVKTIKMNMVR